MVIKNANKLQQLFHGIYCVGSDCVSVSEDNEVIHITVTPQKDASTTVFILLSDEDIAKKYRIGVEFNYSHAEVALFGLYQLRHNQAVDIQATMHHNVPHCKSEQLWRGILDDHAKANFESKIVVAKYAQKTDAQLSNKNLLLSKTAEINTKPILEIYADDVKCAHGATVGCLDENALFYLRSRGIEEKSARELLVMAFANEVLDKKESFV